MTRYIHPSTWRCASVGIFVQRSKVEAGQKVGAGAVWPSGLRTSQPGAVPLYVLTGWLLHGTPLARPFLQIYMMNSQRSRLPPEVARSSPGAAQEQNLDQRIHFFSPVKLPFTVPILSGNFSNALFPLPSSAVNPVHFLLQDFQISRLPTIWKAWSWSAVLEGYDWQIDS